MTDQFVSLDFTRNLLRGLRFLTLAYGAAILGLLVASLVLEDPVMRGLGVQPAPDQDRMVRGMRLVMVVGLAAVPLMYLILGRLLSIVDTVCAGDPFIPANAPRLRTIAFSVLGLEVLHLAVGLVAARSASAVQSLDLNWSFSLTPWVAVLLLFVLAHVFDHGTRLRADLEGTV